MIKPMPSDRIVVRGRDAGSLLREKQTLLASLIGVSVALTLMAAFFVYQKWRYDSARP